jgi:NAD(P)-dependent dehydrogenase (short-subunit alcohol dehydrogenase family)
MHNTKSLSDILARKVAVITGASRGIGRAIAIELAKSGVDVAILSRNYQSLSETKQEIEALDRRCFADSCDVSDSDKLETFLQQAAEHLGPPSILINNAGIYSTDPVAGHSLNNWRSVLETNLTAAMWASRCLLPEMVERKWGRIINVSSISGKSGEPYGAAYSASKFGMIGLTQSLALEVARHGITANAVCPGWVDTKMAIDQLTDERWCELNDIAVADSLEIARLSIPRGEFIQPQEVAALVLFLCSEAARSITGQAINICGGMSLP